VTAKYTVAYELTAAAGASGTATVATVTSGRKLRLSRAHFIFPTGSGFNLQISLWSGAEKIIPDVGYIVGDGHAVAILCDKLIEGGHTVTAHYTNNDASNPHKCLIILEGALE